MNDVLAGVRVLDFGRYIAGPYCAALLADLGADVIRIERRGGGEDRWVAPVGDDGVGRDVPGHEPQQARDDARSRLPRGARDRPASSWPPPTWSSPTCRPRCCARSRSTSTACGAVKPDIILTTVTAFGAGGPWSHKHGFDGIGQVMCGSALSHGHAGAAAARRRRRGSTAARRRSPRSARWPR